MYEITVNQRKVLDVGSKSDGTLSIPKTMNFDKIPHHVLLMTAIGLLISSLWTDHDLNQKFSNLNLLPLILHSSSRVISHTSFFPSLQMASSQPFTETTSDEGLTLLM